MLLHRILFVAAAIASIAGSLTEELFGQHSVHAPRRLPPIEGPRPDIDKAEIDIAELMRPRIKLSFAGAAEADGIELHSTDVSITQPTYPIFGPPPPFINAGYSHTNLSAPAVLDLPANLHEFSLGASWMRPLNDRWMLRFTLSGAFASDMENTGSDAWQLRGGGFAIYRPNDQWTFAFGALATGRDDLPVIPAVGAIWEPTPYFQLDLMMPRPRAALLLLERREWQQWGYVGLSLNGGTWAYQRQGGTRDRVSYKDWRSVLGWELRRKQPPGAFGPPRRTVNAEIGLAFGREFEFDAGAPDFSVAEALVFRIATSF